MMMMRHTSGRSQRRRALIMRLGKTSMEKKRFLSGIARMREGAAHFLALSLHFWSIKEVYFVQNANKLNCKLVLGCIYI